MDALGDKRVSELGRISMIKNDPNNYTTIGKQQEIIRREMLKSRSKMLEKCIDCGDPVMKPSPILGRLCKCRDGE